MRPLSRTKILPTDPTPPISGLWSLNGVGSPRSHPRRRGARLPQSVKVGKLGGPVIPNSSWVWISMPRIDGAVRRKSGANPRSSPDLAQRVASKAADTNQQTMGGSRNIRPFFVSSWAFPPSSEASLGSTHPGIRPFLDCTAWRI